MNWTIPWHMQFQTPLLRGKLIRRYKRFLSDITLKDGREVVAHCANPGAMTGMAEPGMEVWVEPNDDPKRKLKFSWKLCDLGGDFVTVDTGLANGLVGDALKAGRIAEMQGYTEFRAEVKYGDKSRVDFLATGTGLPDYYLEVKSVTLCRNRGLAEFPDTKTARGAKHMGELAAMVDQGHRAGVIFLVNRTDCQSVAVARDIDPAYATAFDSARSAGVDVFCYDTDITPKQINLRNALPFQDC